MHQRSHSNRLGIRSVKRESTQEWVVSRREWDILQDTLIVRGQIRLPKRPVNDVTIVSG